jgi:hypothetical protein
MVLYAGATSDARSGIVDIAEIRRKNLLTLMRLHRQSQADFARPMDVNPAYLSQIITRHNGRSMGGNFARRVEKAYGLDRGWMDRDQSVVPPTHNGSEPLGLSEDAIMVGKTWDELDEATKAHVRALIDKLPAGKQNKVR